MKEKNPFEPYIKEKSEDKIEDTNSFLLNEEMFLDRSFSTFSQTQEKKQEEILSYVEMPILDTEGKTEIIEIPEEKKKKERVRT